MCLSNEYILVANSILGNEKMNVCCIPVTLVHLLSASACNTPAPILNLDKSQCIFMKTIHSENCGTKESKRNLTTAYSGKILRKRVRAPSIGLLNKSGFFHCVRTFCQMLLNHAHDITKRKQNNLVSSTVFEVAQTGFFKQ